MEIKTFSFENINGDPEKNRAEEIKISLEEQRKIVERLAEKLDTSIGEGNTSVVYIDKDHPSICFKVLSKPTGPDIKVNSPEEEVRLMHRAIEVAGEDVAPFPYFFIDAKYVSDDGEEKPLKALVMERVNGCTLDEILKGNCSLPEALEPRQKKDLVKLRKLYLEMDRKVEKLNLVGIFHNDLYPRNVMLDEKGKAYLIDFGMSEERIVLRNEEPPRYDRDTLKSAWMSIIQKAKNKIDKT